MQTVATDVVISYHANIAKRSSLRNRERRSIVTAAMPSIGRNDGSEIGVAENCLQELRPNETERIWSLAQSASDKGDANGMALYGQLLATDAPRHPADFEKAVKLIRSSIEKHSRLGMAILPKLLMAHGDRDKVLQAYELAASLGEPSACVWLQRLFLGYEPMPIGKGPYRPDHAWQNLFIRPILLRNTRCMASPAVSIATDGLEQNGIADPALARHLLFHAADCDDPIGIVGLASSYLDGSFGIPHDEELGETLLRIVTNSDPALIHDPERATDVSFGRMCARFLLGKYLVKSATTTQQRDEGMSLVQKSADEHLPQAEQWMLKKGN